MEWSTTGAKQAANRHRHNAERPVRLVFAVATESRTM